MKFNIQNYFIKKMYDRIDRALGVLCYDGLKNINLCDGIFQALSFDMQIYEDLNLLFIHMMMKHMYNYEIND